jgi:hypothetical protein
MSALFAQFHEAHPDIESELDGVQMSAEQDAAWTAFSAALLARQQAERSALADEIEAEQKYTGK